MHTMRALGSCSKRTPSPITSRWLIIVGSLGYCEKLSKRHSGESKAIVSVKPPRTESRFAPGWGWADSAEPYLASAYAFKRLTIRACRRLHTQCVPLRFRRRRTEGYVRPRQSECGSFRASWLAANWYALLSQALPQVHYEREPNIRGFPSNHAFWHPHSLLAQNG